MVKTHILITMINGNPSHDETTADEKISLPVWLIAVVFSATEQTWTLLLSGAEKWLLQNKPSCSLCTLSYLQYIDIQVLLKYNIEKSMFSSATCNTK